MIIDHRIWALDEVSTLGFRLAAKYDSDEINSTISSGGFLSNNILASLNAANDSPVFGVGLGNVYGVYQSYEIHSTYFGVLAYGGILGILFYIYFMWKFFSEIRREIRHNLENSWARFLYILLPFMIGHMVGWGYTYHIRKREFWILVAFVVVATRLSRLSRFSIIEGHQKHLS